jgi:hypothetical protein
MISIKRNKRKKLVPATGLRKGHPPYIPPTKQMSLKSAEASLMTF